MSPSPFLPLSQVELVGGSFWMWKEPKLNSKTHFQCFNTWRKCGRCMQKHETYAKLIPKPSRLTRLQSHLVTTPLQHTIYTFCFLLFFLTQKLSCTFPRQRSPTWTLAHKNFYSAFSVCLCSCGGGLFCLRCWEHSLLLSAQPIIIPNKGDPRKDLFLVSFPSLLFQTYNNKPDASFFLRLFVVILLGKILLIKYTILHWDALYSDFSKEWCSFCQPNENYNMSCPPTPTLGKKKKKKK